MMKHIIFTGALLLASAVTGEAIAQCTDQKFQVFDVRKLLPGNTICQSDPPLSAVPPAKWVAQEMHIGTTGTTPPNYGSVSGDLIDYKKGSSDPVDPTKKLGTYTLTEPSNVTCTSTSKNCPRVHYKYTAFSPNQTYIFRVFIVSGTLGAAGSVYDFCPVGAVNPSATGTLKIGTGAGCP